MFELTTPSRGASPRRQAQLFGAMVAFLEWRSRRWVARNDSPYGRRSTLAAAALAGVHALNCSYEWAAPRGGRALMSGCSTVV